MILASYRRFTHAKLLFGNTPHDDQGANASASLVMLGQ